MLTKHQSVWDKYKKERNEIKKAKENYYKSEVEQNVGNQKEIWSTINKFAHCKCTSTSSISEVKSGDNSFTEPTEMCEILSNHFTILLVQT